MQKKKLGITFADENILGKDVPLIFLFFGIVLFNEYHSALFVNILRLVKEHDEPNRSPKSGAHGQFYFCEIKKNWFYYKTSEA